MWIYRETRAPLQSYCLGPPTCWVSQGSGPPTRRGNQSLGFPHSMIAIGQQPSFVSCLWGSFINDCSGGLCYPAKLLPGYYGYDSGHRLVTPYISHSYQCGVLQKLMIDGRDYPYHMNPWPTKDSVVGRIDIEDAKLCNNVVWIHSDREHNFS